MTVAADVAVLRDGAIVLAQTWQRRVLRLHPNNEITVLAGGGLGFKDGARATDVDVGDVHAVAHQGESALLVGTDRGLLRLDAAGRIHTVVRGGAVACDCGAVDDPRAVNDDGRNARDVRLTKISKVDTLDGRHPLVLTDVAGLDVTRRLALIAPVDRAGRLAVALPRGNRTLLRRGRVEIVATAPAIARLELLSGRLVVASRRIRLVRGRTRITLRAPRTTKPHVLRLTARNGSAIAVHQLAVIPSRLLARPVLSYIEDAISSLYADAENDASVGCRPHIATRFHCTISPSIGTPSRGVLRLRDDGLITFRKRGDHPLNLVFEPLTFNPRP